MKRRKKSRFIKDLKNVPIISSVCEKLGISRNTVYRWKDEDPVFAKQMQQALNTGCDSINDLAESKIINLIQQNDFRAIRFWLMSNKKKYVRPMLHDFWSPLVKDGGIPEKMQFTVVTAREELEEMRRLEESIKKKQEDWDNRYNKKPPKKG